MIDLEEFSGDTLRRCASGAMSANMALFRLFCFAPSHDAARQALENAIGKSSGDERARLLDAQSLWRDTPDAFELIKALDAQYEARVGSVATTDPIAAIAAGYDRITRLSPSASVASYSLGREDLLEKATAEVIGYLRTENLLKQGSAAVEIGCGIGRFLVALAPELSSVTGVDVSTSMLAHAQERCRHFSNVELLHGDGRGFPSLPSNRFELALAVDSFPHLVEAGEEVVLSNLKDIHRVLRPKGRLLIFNYSYRGDDALDRRDIRRFADRIGFDLSRCGDRPFYFWDGAVFDLEKSD